MAHHTAAGITCTRIHNFKHRVCHALEAIRKFNLASHRQTIARMKLISQPRSVKESDHKCARAIHQCDLCQRQFRTRTLEFHFINLPADCVSFAYLRACHRSCVCEIKISARVRCKQISHSVYLHVCKCSRARRAHLRHFGGFFIQNKTRRSSIYINIVFLRCHLSLIYCHLPP